MIGELEYYNDIQDITNFLQLPDDIFFLFGAEIEFYITDEEVLTKNSQRIIELQEKLFSFAKEHDISLSGFDKEDGKNQFEVCVNPNDWAMELADHIEEIKEFISKNVNATFEAKPYAKLPGSGMHFHVSLYSQDEQNLFIKDSGYSELMYFSIGGLLKDMQSDIDIFAPTENCKKRYSSNTAGRHIQYPTNYSWGFNNRTCAIRIPQLPQRNRVDTRIEHRIASPICNPHDALKRIIKSVKDGIINRIEPPKPIFGNAFDPEYHYVPKIISSDVNP